MKIFRRRDKDSILRFSAPPRCARAVILGVIVGVFVLRLCGYAAPSPNASVVVTDLAGLNRVAVMDHPLVTSLKLDGTVWWSSATEGRVILKDGTAVLQLELDVPCRMPGVGDRLELRGKCLALKTRDVIKLSEVPVVDNDGLHPPEEKSAITYLSAGLHPIRVTWFDRTDRFSLDLEYEGPELPRQMVSDHALFRVDPDAATDGEHFVNGLDYRCCEGAWWRKLPNFAHIPAVKTGTVNNFDIGMRSRDSHVGLQFSGFIEIPKDGDYTFHLRSDDGSRLFIGESSLQILTDGSAGLLESRAGMPAGGTEEPEFQWSEIEGTVAAFHRYHSMLEVDVMTKSGMVKLKVAEDSFRSHTLRRQNRIRVAGVGRRIYNVDGPWVRGEFFVQQWEDIVQQYITPRIWTEYPLVQIGSLMEPGASNHVSSVVHLRGRIGLPEHGGSMFLNDGSGRIRLASGRDNHPVGGSYNVLGHVVRSDSGLMLHCSLLQVLGGAGADADRLPVLTTAEEVCQLSYEEAAKGYPVQVRGVMIGALEHNGAILHDSSRGIYITSADPPMLQVGDYCEVEGVTAPFGFDPHIQVSNIRKLGKGMLPVAIEPTWDQLINGALHCNYVELEGVVVSIEEDSVVLLTRDGRINVRLNPIGADLPPDSLGATIRLRGCLLADWDGESRRVVVGSIYLDQQRVTLIHPAPANPFGIPLKNVGDLLQFDPEAGALQRVRVSGLLIHQGEQSSYLMDEHLGLRFQPVKSLTARVGDRVEVVGFADLTGLSPLLQDAVVRNIGASGLPEPLRADPTELLNDEYDATRVRIEGVLLGVSGLRDGAMLEMQAEHRRFMAMLDDVPSVEDLPEPGSRLELTGVYVGQGGDRVLGLPVDSFHLLLNSMHDITVISRPPWWTLKRLLLVVGLLVGILLASFVWINLLHRQVEERTQQLGDQIRQRQVAERERAIEQERARLAHDLHDDLGAGLTEVNMLSSLVINPALADHKKKTYADKMNALALRMVTSLDEIVWAENPRNDTVSSLADYFESYAYRLFEPVSMGCVVDVANDLPEHPLDPRFRQDVFLAFKEALSNVIKHAGATEVRLDISVRGNDLVVVVSDNGCGILSDTHEAGSDGLVNMQERLEALNGNCEIESARESGTTVRLRAPIGKLMT